jgi:hypothetical protein
MKKIRMKKVRNVVWYAANMSFVAAIAVNVPPSWWAEMFFVLVFANAVVFVVDFLWSFFR